jgi:YVTN family beta-propeller protein
MKELREWCEAVPSPAPSRLTKAQGRLDTAIAREADKHRRAAPGHRAVLPTQRRWPGWMAPLASALAVIAVVAGTFAVASAVRGTRPGHAQAAASTYPGLVCIFSEGGIITRIRDGRVLAPIHVPASSNGIAVTPNGRTAYISMTHGEHRDGVVIPINLATGRVLRPIPVGIWPSDVSITANGKTAYVTNFLSGTVTPIVNATETALAPINVGSRPSLVAVAPDGRTLYVFNVNAGTVTPVRTATGTALQPIRVPGAGSGGTGGSIAVTPDSKTVYVIGSVRSNSGTLTPIQGDHSLKPIVVPGTPVGLAIGPDGKMAYVVSTRLFGAGSGNGRFTITPIDLADGARLPSLTVLGSSSGSVRIVLAPGGKTAYFFDTQRSAVIPIHLATDTAGKPIPTGNGPYHGGSDALVFGRGASIGYLIKSDRVVPLNTATNTTLPPIKVPAIIGWSAAVQR